MMLSTRFNIVYVCVHAMCPASLRHVLLLRAGLPLVLARRLLRHLHGPRAAAYAEERGSEAHKTPSTSDVTCTSSRTDIWNVMAHACPAHTYCPDEHRGAVSAVRALVHSLGLLHAGGPRACSNLIACSRTVLQFSGSGLTASGTVYRSSSNRRHGHRCTYTTIVASSSQAFVRLCVVRTASVKHFMSCWRRMAACFPQRFLRMGLGGSAT